MIAGRRIADDTSTYIIAEIGHNHQGSEHQALRLIEMCGRAKVDAVKFQKRDVRNLYTFQLLNQPYANENSYGAIYGQHRQALELSAWQLKTCFAGAEALGLTGFATAFDEASADELMRIGAPAIKVASGDLQNTPLLRYVATLNVPLIISTGGGSWEDVDRAVQTVQSVQDVQYALLHCTAAYPVRDFRDLNLKCIVHMRERYPDTVIGWSGHDSGIAMALVAHMLGARIVEKHVTLNRALKGTDHPFSLEESGLTKLVRDIRRAEMAMGDGNKRLLPCEIQPLMKMEKSLVGAKDLSVGHLLSRQDLARKSPGGGLAPYLLDDVVGFRLQRPLCYDEPLTFDHLSGKVAA